MTRPSVRAVVTRCGLGLGLLLALTHCGSSQSSDDTGSGGTAGGGTGGAAAAGGASVGGSGGAGGSTGGGGSSGAGGSTGGGGGSAGSGGSTGGAGGSTGGGGSGGTAGATGGVGGVDCDCGRGAYVPVCGADGRTYDAACGISCVTQPVVCMHACPCGDAAGSGGVGEAGGAGGTSAGSAGAAGNAGSFVCGEETCTAGSYCRAPCSGTFGGAGSTNVTPSPSCAPMPATCNGTPTCDCLCGIFQNPWCTTGSAPLPPASQVQCGCA